MQAGETTLKEIIQGEKQYIVPLFQRSYSWGKPQWEQLWSDIVELLENESNSPHFSVQLSQCKWNFFPKKLANFY